MRHDLKIYPIYPEFFNAILEGNKTFEVRQLKDDIFRKGDTLLLQEYIPQEKRFTGNTVTSLVKYVLPGGQYGIEKGYCVMGIKVISNKRHAPHPPAFRHGVRRIRIGNY